MAKQLTVIELVEILMKLPDEQKRWAVSVAGCDCEGEATGIVAYEYNKTILIDRNP